MNKCTEFIFSILTNFLLIANDLDMSFIFRSIGFELKKIIYNYCNFYLQYVYSYLNCKNTLFIITALQITMQAGFDTLRLKGYKSFVII